MSKVSYSEIYEKAVEKASTMCCPDCESIGSLRYADDEVPIYRTVKKITYLVKHY